MLAQENGEDLALHHVGIGRREIDHAVHRAHDGFVRTRNPRDIHGDGDPAKGSLFLPDGDFHGFDRGGIGVGAGRGVHRPVIPNPLPDQGQELLDFLYSAAVPKQADTYGAKGGMQTNKPRAALISGRL